MVRRTTRRIRDRIDRTVRNADVPVDVADTRDEYVVVADLPGYRTQDLDLRVRNDRLQIVADPPPAGQGTSRRPERGRRSRVVRLPTTVDEKHVSASYDDGVLRVHLRKRDPPRTVRVE